MSDTAAWLVDRVIPPQAPVRQWVLSLQYRLRLLSAYDPDACSLVRRVLVGAVSGFYEGRARRAGVARPRTGAVAFVQRFDSGLRLNVPKLGDAPRAVAGRGVWARSGSRCRAVAGARGAGGPGRGVAPQVRGRRYPWAELLRREFEVEALVCQHCGGRRRLLAAVTAPESIERVLRSMGLAAVAPELAPARAPPGGNAEWGA